MYNYKIRAIIMHELEAVIDAFNATRDGKPKDTINVLVTKYGANNAARMVATLVNAVSPYDGRIYDSVRDWAVAVKIAPTNEELRDIGIYGVDSLIHSAHVNEIGRAMRNYMEV